MAKIARRASRWKVNYMARARRLKTAETAWLILALSCVFSGNANGFFDDKLQLSLSEQISYDSNVYRISSGRDPRAVINSTEKGDVTRTTRMGFALDLPAGRQRLQAGYNLNGSRNNRFANRDFDGTDKRAAWLWQFGNDLSGQIGFTESLTLASTANFLTTTPNPLTRTQTYANATYLLDARWRVQAGISTVRQKNGDPAVQANDFESTNPDLSISYVTPHFTTFGVSVRYEDGRFPNRQLVAGNQFDNAYLQRSVGVFTDWRPTGHSHLSGRMDKMTRNYSQLSQRDTDGRTYSLAYDWAPTGKFALSTSVRREVSPLEDIRTSFVLVKGISIRPTWTATSKLTVSGSYDYAMRDYLGDPGLALGTAAPRSETTTTAGVSASFRPSRTLSLGLNLIHDRRTSTLLLSDYSDTLLTLNAQVTF